MDGVLAKLSRTQVFDLRLSCVSVVVVVVVVVDLPNLRLYATCVNLGAGLRIKQLTLLTK